MATTGQVCWPPPGRTHWPLTGVPGLFVHVTRLRYRETRLVSTGKNVVHLPVKMSPESTTWVAGPCVALEHVGSVTR